jgi:hypothetical protein
VCLSVGQRRSRIQQPHRGREFSRGQRGSGALEVLAK